MGVCLHICSHISRVHDALEAGRGHWKPLELESWKVVGWNDVGRN